MGVVGGTSPLIPNHDNHVLTVMSVFTGEILWMSQPPGDLVEDVMTVGSEDRWHVDWHPKRPLIAVGGLGGWVSLLDADTGALLFNYQVRVGTHTDITQVRWKPNGRGLAVSANDGSGLQHASRLFRNRCVNCFIVTWDLASGSDRLINPHLLGPCWDAPLLSWSGDGRLLLAHCMGVSLHDAVNGAIHSSFIGVDEELFVHDIAVNPKGDCIAVSVYDEALGLNHARLYLRNTNYYFSYVYDLVWEDTSDGGGVSFTPNGLHLVAPSSNGLTLLSTSPVVAPIAWSISPKWGSWSPDGNWFMTLDDGAMISLWNPGPLRGGKVVMDDKYRIKHIVVWNSGSYLASCDPGDYRVYLFSNVFSSSPKFQSKTEPLGERPDVFAFSPGDVYLAVVGAGGVVVTSGTSLSRTIWRSSLLISRPGTGSLAWSADGKYIVLAFELGQSGRVEVREADDGNVLWGVNFAADLVADVSCSSDNSMVAVVHDGGSFAILDMRDGSVMHRTVLGQSIGVHGGGVAFDPLQSNRLVVGKDANVYTCTIDSGGLMLTLIPSTHKGTIKDIAWSPSGKWVLSLSENTLCYHTMENVDLFECAGGFDVGESYRMSLDMNERWVAVANALYPMETYPSTRLALTLLFESTGGLDGRWVSSSGWGTELQVCQWEGVRCSTPGVVIGLSLPYNGLNGTISPLAFEGIPHLRTVDLSGNLVSGVVDALQGGCLESVTLRNSGLGTLGIGPPCRCASAEVWPTFTHTLSSLTGGGQGLSFLDLSGNGLSGKASDLPFVSCARVLMLQDNNLDGLGDAWAPSPDLIVINLQDNKFTGPIDLVLDGVPEAALPSTFLSGNDWTCPLDRYRTWGDTDLTTCLLNATMEWDSQSESVTDGVSGELEWNVTITLGEDTDNCWVGVVLWLETWLMAASELGLTISQAVNPELDPQCMWWVCTFPLPCGQPSEIKLTLSTLPPAVGWLPFTLTLDLETPSILPFGPIHTSSSDSFVGYDAPLVGLWPPKGPLLGGERCALPPPSLNSLCNRVYVLSSAYPGLISPDTAFCRFTFGRFSFQVLQRSATWVNSTHVWCEQPAVPDGILPPSGESTVELTLDGGRHWCGPAQFPIFGGVSGMIVVDPPTGVLTCRSSINATIPSVRLGLSDASGNPVVVSDSVPRPVRVHIARADALSRAHDQEDTVEVYGDPAQMVYGEAEVSNLYLVCPTPGRYDLVFEVDLQDLSVARAVAVLEVEMGVPMSLTFSREPPAFLKWSDDSAESYTIASNDLPLVETRDECGGGVEGGVKWGDGVLDGCDADAKLLGSSSQHAVHIFDVIPSGEPDGRAEVRPDPVSVSMVHGEGTERYLLVVNGSCGDRLLASAQAEMATAACCGCEFIGMKGECIPPTECKWYGVLGEGECRVCPENALCNGSASLNVTSNHWRWNNESVAVYVCDEQVEPCLGDTETGTCVGHHRGILCAACEEGYSQTLYTGCKKCLGVGADIVLVILGIVLVAVLLSLYVLKTIGASVAQDTAILAGAKISLNYLQISSTVGTLLLYSQTTRETLGGFITVQETITSVDFTIVSDSSLGCLAPTPPYTRFYIAVMFPLLAVLYGVVLVGVCRVLGPRVRQWFGTSEDGTQTSSSKRVRLSVFVKRWIVNMFDERRLEPFPRGVFMVTTVVLFVGYNMIVRSFVALLGCRTIETTPGESHSFLEAEVDVDCRSGSHVGRMVAVYVFLVLYGLGIPLLPVITIMLWRRREEVDEARIRSTFGFFINNYRPGVFFWDAVVMLLKAAVALVVAVGSGLLMSWGALVLLVTVLVLSAALRPFCNTRLQVVEAASLVVVLGLVWLSIPHFGGASVTVVAVCSVVALVLLLGVLAAACVGVFVWLWFRVKAHRTARRKRGERGEGEQPDAVELSEMTPGDPPIREDPYGWPSDVPPMCMQNPLSGPGEEYEGSGVVKLSEVTFDPIANAMSMMRGETQPSLWTSMEPAVGGEEGDVPDYPLPAVGEAEEGDVPDNPLPGVGEAEEGDVPDYPLPVMGSGWEGGNERGGSL